MFINDSNVTDGAVAPCTPLNRNTNSQQMTVHLCILYDLIETSFTSHQLSLHSSK